MSKLESQFNNLNSLKNLGSEAQTDKPISKSEVSSRPEDSSLKSPIFEDSKSISYLGVKLEKAQNNKSEFVPQREQYADYLNDEFSLELQQKIAVCLKTGDPILVEGGTSIGKTTTVRKMASELGYEVHYVNLNGSTDVEDLMGRYVANAKKKTESDPEFIFADGKVTKGLRAETGKKKVIILDEFNSAAPNILIRLHEVLDALERNGSVVLSEDASEEIKTNKENTKIVALMNPPGKGYLGREPLDPAQLRRWVYVKEKNELPKGTFSKSLRFLAGLDVEKTNLAPEKFLASSENILSLEQLSEIPGIEEIISKYEEFHEAAKEALNNRQIAEDQPQLFNYDDRVEPKRVYNFVRHFYNGDLNETFQKALRYYYLNKLESEDDKQKLEEALRLVEYVPRAESKRKSLEDNAEAAEPSEEDRDNSEKSGSTPEGKILGPLSEQIKIAEKILGPENVLSPSAIEAAFGFKPEAKDIPVIPFNQAELVRAKELKQFLILRVNKAKDGEPLSMKKMNELKAGKTKDKGKILYSNDETGKLKSDAWYKEEKFFTTESPTLGWALVSKEVIPNSTSQDYLTQTETLVDYLQKEVFKGQKMGKIYQDAIDEFKKTKDSIKTLMDSDWQAAGARLEKLKINNLCRQTPVEVLYDILLMKEKNDEYILPNYTWTNRRHSNGELVSVGSADADGAGVLGGQSGNSNVNLGVSFSRSR
jgi:MoxR-like ATPase